MNSKRTFYMVGLALILLSLTEFVLHVTGIVSQVTFTVLHAAIIPVCIVGVVVFMLWHHRSQAGVEQQLMGSTSALDNISEAVIRLDTQFLIKSWNKAAEEMYGWPEAEVLGRGFTEVVPVTYIGDDTEEEALHALLQNDNWRGEVRHQKRTGQQFRALVTVNAIRHPQTQAIIEYFAVVLDVSERHLMERDLQTSHNQLESLVNNASIGLMSIASDYTIVAARGQQLDRLLGQVASFNLVGRSAEVVFAQHKRILLRMESALKGRNASDVLDINGLAFDLRFDPIHDGDSVTGVTMVVFDVTDNQVFDQTLQQYALRLETMRQIDESILALAEPTEIAETTLDYLPFLVPHIASMVTAVSTTREGSAQVTQASALAFRDVDSRLQLIHEHDFPLDWYHSQILALTNSHISLIDISADETPLATTLRELGANVMVVMPLRRGEKFIGLLTIGVADATLIDESRREIIVEIGDILAVAINQALLNQRVKAYAATLEQDVVNLLNEGHVARNLSDTVINHSSDAIVLIDNTLSIMKANPAFARMFGFRNESDWLEKPLVDMVTPDRQNDMLRQLRAAIESREPARFDMEMTRDRSNIPVTVSMAVSPLETIYSGTDGMVINLRDITEEKRKQMELLRAFEHQRELNELRSRFLSTVSHEFCTPLTVIQSSMQLLEMHMPAEKTEKQTRHFVRIHDALQTMVTLLTDVSDMHNMERSAGVATPVQLDPVQLAHSLTESLGIVESSYNIRVIADEAAPRTIEADGTLMRQIMTNLITNAIKYSPRGASIDVVTRYTDNFFVFEVIDNGRGIPPEEHEHLFDPFFRASNVGQEPGTGLGLAIVRRAVDAHYGTISFSSEPGEGTHFKVFIPVTYKGIEKEALA